MKNTINFEVEYEVNIKSFSPFERYIEFDAYYIIDGKKFEFTEEMYALVYDDVYDNQYKIWENNVYDRQVENYILNRGL